MHTAIPIVQNASTPRHVVHLRGKQESMATFLIHMESIKNKCSHPRAGSLKIAEKCLHLKEETKEERDRRHSLIFKQIAFILFYKKYEFTAI